MVMFVMHKNHQQCVHILMELTFPNIALQYYMFPNGGHVII